MSTIKITFADGPRMTLENVKGVGPMGESWLGVSMEDDAQLMFANSVVTQVEIVPDMADKLGLNNGKR